MNKTRAEYLEKLKEVIRENGHIIGVAAGSGITAKYAVMGGCDMIMALSSGKYRQMGFGSLAGFLCYNNSNDMVMNFASKELLRFSSQAPVIFGLNATDPTKSIYDYILEIKNMGFAGINNYPTVGMIDGRFREALDEEGLDYDKEIEAIRFGHFCDLLTVAYVFSPEQARQMVEAGADIICAHFGLTRGGFLEPKKSLTLERARRTAIEIFSAVDSVNPEVIKLVYGGPIKTPSDAQYMYQGSSCQGYIGGSAFERTPIENAVFETTSNFKNGVEMVPSSNVEKLLFANPGQYDYTEFVKEYVNENYMTDVRLNELAQTLYISPSYLSTMFKHEVGINFKAYLLEVRMKKAKELIFEGSHSLVQIAQLVGYNDYAQFSKMYKKINGVSPRENLKK